MAGSATVYTERGVLGHTLAIVPMPAPERVYVALCRTAPTETTGGIEASDGGYSRTPATFALMASPSNAASNAASVEFPVATASWGTIGWFEIWTAATGGTRLYWGPLTDPADGVPIEMDVTTGDVVRFSAGALVVQAADAVMTDSGVSSFNARTGAVTLESDDVMTALTYTPYNSTNPSGYQTAAQVTAAVAQALNNVGRNLIHNGLFNVAQRGVGSWTTAGYTLDRWLFAPTGDTSTVGQSAVSDAHRAQIGDEAATSYLACSVNGTAGAGAFTVVYQPIEDVRRLAGKTITVSFWAISAAALKFGISLDQGFGSGGVPSASVEGNGQTVTLSPTWTRYSLTFTLPSVAGKTLGSNNNHSTNLLFWYSSGATNAVRSGNVGVQTGAINLWGVQLEIGSVATPLEKPDPQFDLANCQRFYQGNPGIPTGDYWFNAWGAGAWFAVSVPFQGRMRAVPTVVRNFTGLSNVSSVSTINVTQDGWQGQLFATAGGAMSANLTSWVASADL